uniref:LytTR family DNA-binding domain-containing protein n=1 Tax=Phytohabitans flavus TaxID=1076124 RepID=UPI00366EBF51
MATAIDKIVNQEAVTGYQNEKRNNPLYQIISVHTESKKVLCETKNGTYYIQKRIYEMKRNSTPKLFIQLSNSEIVNVTQIKAFSLSSTGSYQVDLSNGRRTYTSRRYAQIIRKELLK